MDAISYIFGYSLLLLLLYLPQIVLLSILSDSHSCHLFSLFVPQNLHIYCSRALPFVPALYIFKVSCLLCILPFLRIS